MQEIILKQKVLSAINEVIIPTKEAWKTVEYWIGKNNETIDKLSQLINRNSSEGY